jgi:hypothetical protein
MSDEKKLDYTVRRWLDNKERSLSHKWYAIARIDLLIISISGGGIYILFELIKYYKSVGVIDISGLKVSGVLFMLSISINFISQFFGYEANDCEAKYSNLKFLQAIKEKDVNQIDFDKMDRKGKKYNFLVDLTNWVSVGLMILGLSLLSVHTYFNL